jgi:uncharacterized protein DUF3300
MNSSSRWIVAVSIAALAALPIARAQAPATTTTAAAPAEAKSAVFKKEEIEQLVAPIALYPDSLVAQILMATTYPLEVVVAARWSKANPDVKGKALEDAMQKQDWDASVKSLTAFPQVLAMLYEKLDLTQKLGDAFLAQQKDVLDAIQRLRTRADQAGNLKSGKELTVSKEPQAGATIIKIEPANPEVVYVPTYDPAVVYGPWPYPAYPPYYYYPSYPYGWYPGTAFWGFTAGVIVGAALWGGCNWGGGGVYINHHNYNNFNRTNIKDGNWSHNVDHRKGVGYRDQASRDKFGGGQRQSVQSRDQFRGRADQGRRDIARGGADSFKGSGGVSNRASGPGDRGGRAGDRGAVGGRGGGVSDSRGMSDRGAGFNGVGGSGGATRDFSSRGTSSRGSGSSFSGGSRGGGFSGGGRGGGGGGGGRGGRR